MAKKAKVQRKTLRQKLDEARLAGWDAGHAAGKHDARFEFRPDPSHHKNVTDFVRMIDSWGNMAEEAVIMIAGTDLKSHATGAVPLRLFKVVGEQLRRLGYKP